VSSAHRAAGALAAGLLLLTPSVVESYPLDGYEGTGIRRLRAFELARSGRMAGPQLPPGALLDSEEVRLRLVGVADSFRIDEDTPRDPYLQRGLERIFGNRDPNYSIALLEITDPARPRYAALRETRRYQPGSIGKLAVLAGLFADLAQAHPDTARRLQILRETPVTGGPFVPTDHHRVPIVDLEAGEVAFRVIREDDRFSLWEWADHMVSPSANAAGSVVWRETMLLDRFRDAYPPDSTARRAYLGEHPARALQADAVRVANGPLREIGIPEEGFRQGTFFTEGAQQVVPPTSSHWTPRAALRLLLAVEQGRLVDRWSSLEFKRMLYFTRRRYRYASSPALRDAAVYFKSGSLYACEPEPGFECRPYEGNRFNYMNSVSVVESPARGADQRVYLVALASNVLRRNSAAEHRDLATEIERLVRNRPEPGEGGPGSF